MRNHWYFLFLISVLMVWISPQAAYADDVFDPGWRGAYGTVVVGCGMWSEEDASYNGTGYVHIGSQTNPGWPGGPNPFPWARYHNATKEPWSEERDNTIEVHPGGDITIGLPNYAGGFQKLIFMQVTTLLGGVGNVEIWDNVFDPNTFQFFLYPL